MKRNQYEKYIYIGITAFLVIALSIIVFFCIFRFEEMRSSMKAIFNILMPVIYGLVIAYLLTPVYNFFMKKCMNILSRYFKNDKMTKKWSSGFSVGISLLLLILAVIGLFYLVIPQVLISIFGIVESFPKNVTKFSEWLAEIFQNNPQIEKIVLDFYNEGITYLENWMRTYLLPNIEKIITGVSSGVLGAVVMLKNIFIGLVVAIYVLAGKEHFLAQSKKITYSILKVKAANAIIAELRYAHKVFGGFIVGKLLDSLIIGIICFIGLRIMKMPYVMLISVIIGVTNIIPFFGPFIGAVPCGIILLLVDPMKCLYFIIFIFLLQQFDGNILGPKILGDSTGLSSFWVLSSILFFGGLWGFVGMIVGVPLFAVIYHMVSVHVNESLKKKKLSIDTMYYLDIQKIDEKEEEIAKK